MKPNLAYGHLVASVLAADGHMDDAERDFLAALLRRLELDPEEIDAVMHFEGAEGAEEAARALPEADRRALMDDVLGAVLADGKVTPLEQRRVQALTEVLGL